MLTLVLALVVCLLGAVVYMASSGKASQLGLYAFAVGLLATLLQISGSVDVRVSASPPAAHLR